MSQEAQRAPEGAVEQKRSTPKHTGDTIVKKLQGLSAKQLPEFTVEDTKGAALAKIALALHQNVKEKLYPSDEDKAIVATRCMLESLQASIPADMDKAKEVTFRVVGTEGGIAKMEGTAAFDKNAKKSFTFLTLPDSLVSILHRREKVKEKAVAARIQASDEPAQKLTRALPAAPAAAPLPKPAATVRLDVTKEITTLPLSQQGSLMEAKNIIDAALKGDDIDTITREIRRAESVLEKELPPHITTVHLSKNPSLIWKKGKKIDENTLRNFIIEKKQITLTPGEFQIFNEKMRTHEIEKRAHARQKGAEEYRNFAKETFTLDNSLQKIWADNNLDPHVEKWWKDMNGRKNVETIMHKSPFEIDEKRVGPLIESLMDKDSEVNFEKVLEWVSDHKTDFKRLSTLPEKTLSGVEEFFEHYDELEGKEAKNTRQEQWLELMNNFLIQATNLLAALSQLKYEPGSEKAERKEAPQDQISKNLTELTRGERAGEWASLMAAFGGASSKEVTLSRIDGATFTVDKGTFNNRYSEASVVNILKKRRGLYTIENGATVLHPERITAEINRLITLGYLNAHIKTHGNSEVNKEELATLHIGNIGENQEFTAEQKQYFQMGFVIDEASRFQKNLDAGVNALTEIENLHPSLTPLLRELLEKGVPIETVKKVNDRLIMMIGAEFVIQNGELTLNSAQVGIPIPLGDGYTLMVRLGATRDGEAIAGLGLSVEVYKGEDFSVHIDSDISLQGVGAGAHVNTDMGKVMLTTFAGAHWSWDRLIPSAGGGFLLGWDLNQELQEEMKERRSANEYDDLWKEWEKNPRLTTAEKVKMLKENHPDLWAKFEPLHTQYGLTEQDIITSIELAKTELTREALDATGYPIPILSHVGFAVVAIPGVGPVFVPVVGIQIGSATINVPHRNELSRTSRDISSARAMQAAVKEIESHPTEYKLYEETPELYMTAEGGLRILEKRIHLDLNKFITNPESYNASLQEAEVALKNQDGDIALEIYGTENQDTELYIDPALTDIAVVKEGNRFIIKGNLQDTIIDRERFTSPFNIDIRDVSTNVVDKITIRKAASLEGGRTNAWIERNCGAYAQKLNGEQEWMLQHGPLGTQNNFFESTDPRAQEQLAQLKAKGALTPEMISRNEALHTRAMRALDAVDIADYQKQTPHKEIFTALDTLLESDKDFKKRLGALTADPDGIAKLIMEYSTKVPALNDIGQKGHELALNEAVSYLTNRWFTVIATREELQKSAFRTKLIRRIEQRIAFVRNKVFIPEFIKILGPTETEKATRLVDKMLGDTFNGLLEKLKDPTFDFAQIEVDEIPKGAYFFSGSRTITAEGKEGALAIRHRYETLDQNEALAHGFGFLREATGKYSLQSESPEEREIARILLEIASPIPKDALRFLESPLPLKIFGMHITPFLLGEETYAHITELYESKGRAALLTQEKYKTALQKFTALVQEVRDAQLKGTAITREIGDTGVFVELTLHTDIVYGAFTQCANPSGFVIEKGMVKLMQKDKVSGTYTETNETVGEDLQKVFINILAAAGFRTEKVSEQAPPEEDLKNQEEGPSVPKNPGKSSGQGPATTTVEGETYTTPGSPNAKVEPF